MLSYNESLKILKETNALQGGHFILSSGLHSNKYIQCATLLSNPIKAEIICKSLSEKIVNEFEKVDLILSPAIGGIVVGYEIGRQLKKKTIFAERTDGEMIIRRGFEILPNLNVVIVEDVITTGKSALECSKLIKINKANLLGYACIIDRSDEKLLIKDKIISQIKFSITTYRENEIPDNLKKIAPQKPGSRNFTK